MPQGFGKTKRTWSCTHSLPLTYTHAQRVASHQCCAKVSLKLCRLVPKLHHFQVLYVSIYSKNTTALLGGRKQQEVRKIYNAHRQTAKISRVVEPDVPGSRATCSLVGRMEYPYQAIGMVAKVNASGPFGFCTGWMIRHNLVVTAAHCVYNSTKRRPSWPGHLRFLPQVSE